VLGDILGGAPPVAAAEPVETAATEDGTEGATEESQSEVVAGDAVVSEEGAASESSDAAESPDPGGEAALKDPEIVIEKLSNESGGVEHANPSSEVSEESSSQEAEVPTHQEGQT